MKPVILQTGAGSLARLASHTNAGLEMVHVRRGHLLWQTEGRTEPVPPGSVYFTLPGQIHGSSEEFEPGHEWVYAILAPGKGCLLHPALGFAPDEARRIERELRRARRHAYANGETIGWLLSEIHRERTRKAPYAEEKLSALARAAVVELVRLVRADAAPRVPAVRDAARERVRGLISEIAAQPETSRSLEGMARACGLGRTQFSRLLREQTGDSPTRFLQRMRVRAACRLLRESHASVTEIAHACGFGTSQYFAHIFRRMTGGLTALAYRRIAKPGRG